MITGTLMSNCIHVGGGARPIVFGMEFDLKQNFCLIDLSNDLKKSTNRFRSKLNEWRDDGNSRGGGKRSWNRFANATVRVERLSWTDELNCPVASLPGKRMCPVLCSVQPAQN